MQLYKVIIRYRVSTGMAILNSLTLFKVCTFIMALNISFSPFSFPNLYLGHDCVVLKILFFLNYLKKSIFC